MLRGLTHTDRERLQAEFEKEAGEQFKRMFDAQNQAELVTFDQREARALDIGDGLARWVLEHHLGNDVKAVSNPDRTDACPKCGRACAETEPPGGSLPPRSVQTGAGSVELARPEFRCPRCRRSFSPDGPRARPQHRGL